MNTPENITFVAVPVPLLAAVFQTLNQLPYGQVAGLVPEVERCLNDDHKVEFPPVPAMDAIPTE